VPEWEAEMEMRCVGKFQEVVGRARWSEGAIFGAQNCAKWRARNIICSARDFSASVGAAKTHLRVVNWRFFGRGAILAPLLEML
jgi:hypothetical protein